jgi:hypothetical protein
MATDKNFEQALEKVLDELCTRIQSACDIGKQAVMEQVVVPDIEEVVRKHVNEDIYDVKEPKYYHRRKEDGGLISHDNIRVTYIPDEGITIANITPFAGTGLDNSKPEALTNMLSMGYGKQDAWYNKPRPFLKNAVEEIEKSELIKRDIQHYLPPILENIIGKKFSRYISFK